MITLRTSLGSPYGRKARIVILPLGLAERVRVEPPTTFDPADPIHAINPLHKIPALVTEDGVASMTTRSFSNIATGSLGAAASSPSNPPRDFVH